MTPKHKKSIPPKLQNDKTSSIQKDEYDLRGNINKISKYGTNKAYSRQSCSTDTYLNRDEQKSTIQGDAINYSEKQTGTNSWETYTHLDDKLSNIQSSNETAHTQLRNDFGKRLDDTRKDLESKIEKKLSMQWYVWTVSAIVAIVVLIYFLSYKNIEENSNQHESSILAIEGKISNIETQIQDIKCGISETLNKENVKTNRE